MKRGTPRHPKMYALSEKLGITLAHAVGIMELLWHHAGQFTPRGDIGSIPDSAIAEAVGWTKRRLLLIDTLVDSRWLDRDPEHRLVVHDWPEHCEQSVIKWLEYNKKDFLPIYRVSLENRKRKDRKSHPSREAKAKEEAVEIEISEQEIKSFSPQKIFSDGGPLFEQLIGVFLAAGAALNEQDQIAAATEWVSMPETEQAPAVEFLVAKTARTEPRFMGLPANYLRKREWTRKGLGRLLPAAREPTKREKNLEMAAERFMEAT